MTIDVLASADADLRFQMEEAGVSADVQKAIYAEGFTSVRVFAGLEESREGVRAALKSSFVLELCAIHRVEKERESSARVPRFFFRSVVVVFAGSCLGAVGRFLRVRVS